jgi:hypothetical protein
LEQGEPQGEDDGTGTQRVVVVDGDDPSATDLCGQPSRRVKVGARQPQRLAARGEPRATADPIPPEPMIAVLMANTSAARH